MKPIPLFGSGVYSYSAVVTRQRRLNVIYDMRTDQDRGSVIAVGTSGSTVFVTLDTYPIRGFRVVGSLLYVVSGKTLYTVNAGGTVTTIGTMPTVNTYVSMADDSVKLIIADGVAGYSIDLATSVISTISDVNFPNGCTSLAVLNSKIYAAIPDTRQFRQAQVLAGDTWTPEVYGTKENASDLLLAADVINGTLILWGTATTEQWQDVGAYPLSVQRIQGATQEWGLAAVRSRAQIGNGMYFLGQSPDGSLKVMSLAGGAMSPISNSDIETLISNFVTVTDAIGAVYSCYGHPIYHLTFPTEDRTLAFDTTTGVWHEAQTGLAVQARHFGDLSVAFNGMSYMSDGSSGSIFLMDEGVRTDNGVSIPREVCSRHIRESGNQIFLDRLFLDFETGVGNSAATNPQVMVSISRDGGRTFGPEKFRSIGAVGKYVQRVTLNRLGSGFDLVVRIRVSDAVKFILCGASAEIEVVNA